MSELVEETPPQDRYARPRMTQAERLRSPVVEAHRWRLFALMAMVGFLATTGSTIYFASRRTVEIFPLTIDQDNHVRAVGALEVPADRQMLAIKHDLRAFDSGGSHLRSWPPCGTLLPWNTHSPTHMSINSGSWCRGSAR